jgi:hydroxyethylthiazole kinase-like uncharacterized protein yjeF
VIRPELLELLREPTVADDKYSRGVVGFVTGSLAFPGAAILGVTAAIRCGIGLVRYVGPREVGELVLLARPEAVLQDGRADAWVLGSGVDQQQEALQQHLDQAKIAVVDAGAISSLDFARAPNRTVLTPHAGELAALLSSRNVEADRATIEAQPVEFAKAAAQLTDSVVLLKGNTTYLAAPNGALRVFENLSRALSTAGTGDVLAGAIASLCAQNCEKVMASSDTFLDVIELAVLLHSRAAELSSESGPVAALDVAESLRTVIEELK